MAEHLFGTHPVNIEGIAVECHLKTGDVARAQIPETTKDGRKITVKAGTNGKIVIEVEKRAGEKGQEEQGSNSGFFGNMKKHIGRIAGETTTIITTTHRSTVVIDGEVVTESHTETHRGRSNGGVTLPIVTVEVPESRGVEIRAAKVKANRLTSQNAGLEGILGVDVSSHKGNLRLKSMSGEIGAHATTGAVRANSLSGDVKIEAATGNVTVETMSGNITVSQAEGEAVTLTTSSGTIRSLDLRGIARIKSMNGDVYLGGTFEELNCETMSGSVEMRGSKNLAVAHIRTMSGDVDVEVPEGMGVKETNLMGRTKEDGTGAVVRISTMSGDVKVNRIPAKTKKRTKN